MEEENDLARRTLTIRRTFDAPIALVWEAWTQPQHIARWWGPKGMKTTIVEHDFRVGGRWEYKMKMPDGSDFTADGVFSLIVRPERIFSSANFRPMTEGVELRAVFTESGNKTGFTFSVVHPTEEYCRQQEKMGFYNGWGSTFDRLEGFIDTLRKESHGN